MKKSFITLTPDVCPFPGVGDFIVSLEMCVRIEVPVANAAQVFLLLLVNLFNVSGKTVARKECLVALSASEVFNLEVASIDVLL
jgi:hypothetical protein